jgi:histidine triad (HIT) family protein
MSLDGNYDPGNIFALMLEGKIPCHKVYEDEVALAFMDIFPQASGHVLVIPKTPARNMLDFPADRWGAYMQRVQTVASGVRRALRADGLSVMQFNGSAGGQTVFHLHFHIIPRREGDRMAGHGSAGRADDAVLASQASAIAAAINGG